MIEKNSPFVHLSKDIFKLQQALPPWFFYYVIFYGIALFLLVFYIPANDVDSMMVYLPRIKLEELGAIEQTATDIHQFIFPQAYLYFHKPLLALGYFNTLPNFILFLSLLAIIVRKFTSNVIFFAFIFVFGCQTLLLGATSIKYDFPSGIIAFLGWFAICHFRNKTWYLGLCSLPIFILPGIKWTAIPLSGFLAILMIFMIIKERLINRKAVLIFLLLLPFYWLVSSADIYLTNLLEYNSLTPRLLEDVWGKAENISFFTNAYNFLVSSIFSTFTLTAYFIDAIFHTKLLIFLSQITNGIVNLNVHSIVTPAAGANRTGILMLILLGFDVFCLVSRKVSFPIKSLALIALAYTLILLYKIPYSTDLYCRYFLPTYIFSIVPASIILGNLCSTRIPFWKGFKHLIAMYALLVSLHCLLLSQEKNLIKFTVVDVTSPDYPTAKYDSLFHYDREQLYFMGWRGYLTIHEFFREHILQSNSLLYINTVSGHQNNQSPPFIYPFIKDRNPANTHIINPQSDPKDALHSLGKYEYVMIYKGEMEHPLYDRVFEYGGQFAVNIYRLKPLSASQDVDLSTFSGITKL